MMTSRTAERYLTLDQVHDVHLEITIKCNALCPQCSRVYREKINPIMPISELSLEDIKKFFVPAICGKLRHVY
ncbi:MAG: hypothetical protein KDD43_07720, partial [Bdellovibrionales bacterium]|nr:hypothetical protein [Bdellovibrionales bacterium]